MKDTSYHYYGLSALKSVQNFKESSYIIEIWSTSTKEVFENNPLNLKSSSTLEKLINNPVHFEEMADIITDQTKKM